VRAIRDACHELAAGTRSSRSAEDIRAGYRKAYVGSHILFFRRTESGLIDIVRVLHRRMDPTRHIEET
jgi:toxin ParE1/3/4